MEATAAVQRAVAATVEEARGGAEQAAEAEVASTVAAVEEGWGWLPPHSSDTWRGMQSGRAHARSTGRSPR
jgi:hypothetical protein